MASVPGGNTGDTSSSNTTGAQGAASAVAQDVVDKLGRSADRAASGSAATSDKVRRAGHSAVDKAVNAAAPAAQWIENKQTYIQDQLKTTTDYVVANPLKSVGIAFLVGVLYGRLTA